MEKISLSSMQCDNVLGFTTDDGIFMASRIDAHVRRAAPPVSFTWKYYDAGASRTADEARRKALYEGAMGDPSVPHDEAQRKIVSQFILGHYDDLSKLKNGGIAIECRNEEPKKVKVKTEPFVPSRLLSLTASAGRGGTLAVMAYAGNAGLIHVLRL
eukprot:GHVO01032685.1.p1 GENE.GHVO01032685.1~~GHVO01032685.1.p1  ORF type:complete len:168 (+),score=42.74 GHVO01032685.1:35-505(+)